MLSVTKAGEREGTVDMSGWTGKAKQIHGRHGPLKSLWNSSLLLQRQTLLAMMAWKKCHLQPQKPQEENLGCRLTVVRETLPQFWWQHMQGPKVSVLALPSFASHARPLTSVICSSSPSSMLSTMVTPWLTQWYSLGLGTSSKLSAKSRRVG